MHRARDRRCSCAVKSFKDVVALEQELATKLAESCRQSELLHFLSLFLLLFTFLEFVSCVCL